MRSARSFAITCQGGAQAQELTVSVREKNEIRNNTRHDEKHTAPHLIGLWCDPLVEHERVALPAGLAREQRHERAVASAGER